MNILVIAANYPHPGYRFSGIFNERSVHALSKLCDQVEVLVPRPYAPPVLSSFVARWRAYAAAEKHEIQNGISVHRPVIPVVPHVAQAFWSDHGAFLWCRSTVRKMHQGIGFDAIVSFDLTGAGGLAWRLGHYLGIAASGWATGSDIRVSGSSAHGRAVTRALRNLDLVFYQSHELLEKAGVLLGVSPERLAGDRHVVLARGIPEPPQIAKTPVRNRIRASWDIKTDEVVVLYLGRISRKKGLLELLEALSLAMSKDSRLRCVMIGSKPGFDDTHLIKQGLHEIPGLNERVILLPECSPDKVWDNLSAADIFAFPSHNEGMPNSLLEAMASGVPCIAFAIPPVREIEDGTGALLLVRPCDSKKLSDAILYLARNAEERICFGDRGRERVRQRFMLSASMSEAIRRLAMTRNGTRPVPRVY